MQTVKLVGVVLELFDHNVSVENLLREEKTGLESSRLTGERIMMVAGNMLWT